MFRHCFLAAFLTDRAIFGQKGIDVRFRLGLYRALKQRGLSDLELKDVMCRALPLNLGERLTVLAGVTTILGGVLFIGLADEPVRDFVLQIHRVFDGPLDYVLLLVQWLAFYVSLSLLAFALACIIAIGVYSSRIWKFY